VVFDVARLIDHLVGWVTSFAARVSNETFDGDPSRFQAGADPAGDFGAAARIIVAAYRAGGHEAQQLPVGMLLMEYVVHGWDLAIATGQPVPFTDAEAESALTTGRQMLKPKYRGPGKTFGFEVHVAETASQVDQLVAFLGRAPDWQPAGAR
jgi:uncharacterized protein (TIGR03086 family)